MRRALLGLLVACSSRAPAPASKSETPRDAGVVIDAVVPAASCAPGTKIENGTCAKDADCVLTDLPDACDACNLDMAYPARRAAFDRRVARCATTSPCLTGCPPHDTYIPAFYRAECRDHRCIAWRYHGGG